MLGSKNTHGKDQHLGISKNNKNLTSGPANIYLIILLILLLL